MIANSQPESLLPAEKPELSLGFVPLTDCAPLAIAHEKGFFERWGLQVTLHREHSWASIRDKIAYGIFDGAQMLAPMPLALTLGVGGVRREVITSLVLDLNGNAITVSNQLYAQMQEALPEAMAKRPITAEALKAVIEQRVAEGLPKLTLGKVFSTSTHNYELRYWMASAGIDPDNDVKLIVVPPPDMPGLLKAGRIDGFCVGEPWNAFAVQRGYGTTLITKHELWANSAEKVLGVTRDWANQYPNTHARLIAAIIEACAWIDETENRPEVVGIISDERYIQAPEDVVRMSMLGTYQYEQDGPREPMPDFNVFYRYGANFPWRSYAVWFLTQMQRWQQWSLKEQAHADTLQTIAEHVFQPDPYRRAAEALGIPAPFEDYKQEGVHTAPWVLEQASAPLSMGPDAFFDNKTFDALNVSLPPRLKALPPGSTPVSETLGSS